MGSINVTALSKHLSKYLILYNRQDSSPQWGWLLNKYIFFSIGASGNIFGSAVATDCRIAFLTLVAFGHAFKPQHYPQCIKYSIIILCHTLLLVWDVLTDLFSVSTGIYLFIYVHNRHCLSQARPNILSSFRLV